MVGADARCVAVLLTPEYRWATHHTPQASHGNGYTPPSLDQTLTFPVDDPFVNATAGLDDIVEDAPVPSADVEAPTASLLQFTGAT